MPENPDKARRRDGTQPSHGRDAGLVNGKQSRGSRLPPGVDLTRGDGPPPKTFSLYAHYRWRFELTQRKIKVATSSGDSDECLRQMLYLDALCTTAMRDLLLYQGAMRRSYGDTDAENVEKLLTEWQGVAAHEVAVWLMCSPQWVRKSRQAAGVDPEYGERPVEDERRLEAHRLAREGMKQTEIAARLGVAQPTISKWLRAA